MWKYMVLVATHLSWLFNFLLHHSFSFSKYYDHELHLPAETTESLSIAQYYKTQPATSSIVECAVCLCKIEEGEEITELRCAHLFHRVCLDRWARVRKRATCPLCRNCLAPPMTEPEFGFQVLVFRFCSFGSDGDHRDTWWLR